MSRSKAHVRLFRGDLMRAEVQVVQEGGENNLHAHPTTDGFWMVLAGRAKFYTTGDELVADLGPHEGVHVPRGFQYWFESSAEAPLELLHVSAKALGEKGPVRVDVAPRKKDWKNDKQYLDGAV
ncbi:cupin domain-containing protein [Actinophytocola sp.]|uniref:cupin domain-containing protein n=1 Tax=Actinophytocola sp. TaxID=1872138 RepID=UPI003D6B31F2